MIRCTPLLLLAGCAISSPLEGPGYADGALVPEAQGPLVVAVTHTRAKRGETDAFDASVDAIVAQLDTQPGLVGHSLRGELLGRDRWTLTVWESNEDLTAFVTSGAHLEAMGQWESIVDDVYSTSFTTESPSWDEALDHLAEVEPAQLW